MRSTGQDSKVTRVDTEGNFDDESDGSRPVGPLWRRPDAKERRWRPHRGVCRLRGRSRTGGRSVCRGRPVATDGVRAADGDLGDSSCCAGRRRTGPAASSPPSGCSLDRGRNAGGDGRRRLHRDTRTRTRGLRERRVIVPHGARTVRPGDHGRRPAIRPVRPRGSVRTGAPPLACRQ